MLTAPALSMRKCPVMNLVMRLGGGSHFSNATAVVLPLLSRSMRKSQPALKMSSKGPRLGNKRGLLVLSAAASTTSLPVRTTRPSWSPALKTPPESPTISHHLTFTETFHTTSMYVCKMGNKVLLHSQWGSRQVWQVWQLPHQYQWE